MLAANRTTVDRHSAEGINKTNAGTKLAAKMRTALEPMDIPFLGMVRTIWGETDPATWNTKDAPQTSTTKISTSDQVHLSISRPLFLPVSSHASTSDNPSHLFIRLCSALL